MCPVDHPRAQSLAVTRVVLLHYYLPPILAIMAAHLGGGVMSQPLSYYQSLTGGGKYQVELSQDEAAVTLKIYDHGTDHLSRDEKELLANIIAKLKDQVWP